MLVEKGKGLNQLVGDVLLDDVVAVLTLDQMAVVLQHCRQRIGVVLRHAEAVAAFLDEALVRQQVRVLAVHGGLQEGNELRVASGRQPYLFAQVGAWNGCYLTVAEHARLFGLTGG